MGDYETNLMGYADRIFNQVERNNDDFPDGSRNTYAFVTNVKNPLSQSTFQAQYDYSTGKPTVTADLRGQYTTYSYSDPLDRLTQVNLPNGGHKTYSYSAPAGSPPLSVVAVSQDQNTPGDGALQSSQIYDGLGRLVQSRTIESATQWIATSEAYDALGRVAWTTNPVRNTDSASSIAYTNYSYDALGRQTVILYPDGSQSTSAYSGGQVLETDPAGKMKRVFYDGLGRLIGVVEDPNGLSYGTGYSYDALGNLVTVWQGPQPSPQGRFFSYDSLSRLTSAQNPESGTVTYSYDNDGNLTQRKDNRGTTTNYSYTALNQLFQQTYSDTTPGVTYSYGMSGNSNGQLTSVSNGNSTTNYTNFDVMGNVLASSQVTQGQTYNFSYGYNLAGALTSETYPSGRTITTSYDTVNRPLTVQGICRGRSRRM